MQFFDESLLPENQAPLVIQVAPYAPCFLPRDSNDIPVTFYSTIEETLEKNGWLPNPHGYRPGAGMLAPA